MSSVERLEPETISKILKNCFFSSPSHGIRRIGRAKTLIGSLLWTYISWVFTVFMAAFIYATIINYIARPTKIHLSVRQHRVSSDFPAVTFCNINPLKDDGFLSDYRKPRLPTNADSSPASSNESEYRKAVSTYINRILSAQVNGDQHPFIKWGFSLHDLLISCTYNKRRCKENLTPLFHPDYGNCYTFDNDKHVQSETVDNVRYDWTIDKTDDGNNYKLVLELFLHQFEYNEYLDHRAAFRIFIHQKHELPILSQNSLFLRPNRYTKLSFSQRIMSFSRQCRKELTEDMKRIFTEEVRYTQALCYEVCEQRFLERHCNCIEPALAVFYQFFNNGANINNHHKATNISLCSIDDLCLTTRFDFNSKRLCGDCLPECDLIQYSVQSSHASYPNVNAYSKILQRVRKHFEEDGPMMTLLSNDTFDRSRSSHHVVLRDNIVAVEISASSSAIETLTESPVYTWIDLISSIGGQTGLWIGVSLISFVESIDLFHLLIDRCYVYLVFRERTVN